MHKIYDGILGLVVGDALGVPVEFYKREDLDKCPIKDMVGWGTHNQPPYTWSDDTSMVLATMNSLIYTGVINYQDIMEQFSNWFYDGEYTPYGEVFDYGSGTAKAIQKYKEGILPLCCGGMSEGDNGNGSLMRILPIVFLNMPFKERMKITANVSRLTHGHSVSILACCIYVSIANCLITIKDKDEAVSEGFCRVANLLSNQKEWKHFKDIPIVQFKKRDAIRSTGYVVDTLEAALWCFLHGHDYKSTVLMAVNLGEDTDTIAAVVGGLAGIIYGADDIPLKWVTNLPRVDYIINLCKKFSERFK